MPQYEVSIPGKGTFRIESPEELSEQQVYFAASQEASKKTGLLAAVGKGTEGVISSSKTALQSVFGDATEAGKQGLERGEKSEYADQVSMDKVKEAYNKKGLLSAVGEVGKQIPLAILEQAPNIGASLASARLGAMAGSAVGSVVPGLGTGIGALVGGGIGAFAPSLLQQLGGNVERQVAETGEAKLGKATAAAVPQAALDVASNYIPLGKQLIGKLLGPEVTAALNKGGKEAAEKLAKESLLKAAAKGTVIGGVAEVPTEVIQSALERAQAGLPVLSADAYKEYGETAYQSLLLAPLGGAGRVANRSVAQTAAQAPAPGEAPAKAPIDLAAEAEAARAAQEAAKAAQPSKTDVSGKAVEEVPTETPAVEVPPPKVRKKGVKNVAVPPVVEPGEATAIEPDGAGAIVAGMGVDSQPDAVAAPVQTQAAGVGVSELPATDGNAPEGLAAPTVIVNEKPYTIVSQDEGKFVVNNGMKVPRTGKLGKAIETQLAAIETPAAIETAPAIETPAAIEATAPAVETPTVETPPVETPTETAPPVEPKTDPFALLTSGRSVEGIRDLEYRKKQLLDNIKALTPKPKKQVIKEGVDAPAPKTKEELIEDAINELPPEAQSSLRALQAELEGVNERINTAKQEESRVLDVAKKPTKKEIAAANKAQWDAAKNKEKAAAETAEEEIQKIIQAVGAYNQPTGFAYIRDGRMVKNDLQRRYVATDYIYQTATEENQKPSVKQFALKALRYAIDPKDMRPSLRAGYDRVVKNVGPDDSTNWGSFRYNVQSLNKAVPTPDGFAETAAKGQTRKALQVVLNHPQSDPITKLVIRSILKAGTLPKLSVVPEGTFGADTKSKKVRVGEYDPVSDTIRLAEGYVTAANLIHEVIHGFLHRKIEDYLSGKHKDAQIKRIDDLFQYLTKNHPELAESYGMTDLSEFVSEVMSNGSFQDKLQDIPYKKGSFFSEFAKAVLKLLGINDNTPKWNALTEALISTESVMQSGRLLQEARTGIPGMPSVSNITTPGAVAAAANADIIGETVRPTAISALRKFFSTKVNKTYLFDKLNSIDEKLTAGYLGRLRDALGNINPKELLAQALDAARLTERAFVEGFLELTPDGMFTAAKGKLANGNDASLTRIIEIVNNSAKQSGESIETTRRVLSSLLVGHREFNLDAHNKATGSSVPLRIKNDVERNDLERQFQANPDAQEIYAIMEAMRFNRIGMMVHSGRISQDTADFWKNTPGYVPYQDIDELNDKIAAIKNGSGKGLAGTSRFMGLVGPDTNPQVGDVIDSFMDLMARMSLDAIKVNAVSKASETMRLLGHAKRISPATSLSQEEKTHTVDTYVNGVRARYYYKDALDAAAFAGMPSEISSVVSGLQTFARTLRSGVTLVPAFAVGQVLNDVFRAYAQSDVMRPAALIPRILLNFPAVAYRQYTGKKSDMDIRMENMGVMATFDVSTEGTLKNIMQEVGAEKRSFREQVLHIAESISKGSDMAVRQAIYAQSMKETKGDEALSMARAREIINFSRRGQSNALDMIIRTVPFTNAYIRGMDKLITAARGTTGAYGMTRAEAKAMFRNRMLTLGAIGFTYALMMAGDDEYEKLDDSIRDTHFVFPSLKIGDSPVAIPLPRDLAFIFKAIPERIVNYVRKYGTPEEQNGIRVIGELLKQGAGTIAAPNVTPTVLLPLLENITNYSAFLGRPLESQSQQTRESFLASGRGTSEVSKGLSKGLSAVSKGFGDVGLGSIGSMFEVSPVKLENLFRGLLGTSGALLLAMGDEILAPERADKTTARSVLAQLTGASALMVDPVGRKQLNEFFDLYEKLDKVGSSLKYLEEKDPEEAVKYAREHEAELNVLDEAKIIYQNIQVLNKDAQEVDLDKRMSGKQKLQAISKIVRDQNLTARKVDEIKSYLDKHK